MVKVVRKTSLKRKKTLTPKLKPNGTKKKSKICEVLNMHISEFSVIVLSSNSELIL